MPIVFNYCIHVADQTLFRERIATKIMQLFCIFSFYMGVLCRFPRIAVTITFTLRSFGMLVNASIIINLATPLTTWTFIPESRQRNFYVIRSRTKRYLNEAQQMCVQLMFGAWSRCSVVFRNAARTQRCLVQLHTNVVSFQHSRSPWLIHTRNHPYKLNGQQQVSCSFTRGEPKFPVVKSSTDTTTEPPRAWKLAWNTDSVPQLC